MQARVRQAVTFFENFDARTGIGWRAQLAVFCIAVLAFIARRPDALFHAQFYAEDGTIWYADAYNSGWLHALLVPHTGYFQTLPRLAAALSLLVPLRFAPLVMNAVGIALQVLPINFLLSVRCANWGPLSLRALFSFAYLVLPNTSELDATITEGQWHLALLAALVVLAAPPLKAAWRIFDVAVLLLSGLTGPFCIALLPIAVVFGFLRRAHWRLAVIGTLAVGVALQAYTLFETAVATRSPTTLGVTPELLLTLVAGRVYLAALVGKLSLDAQQHIAVLVLALVAGTAILLYTFKNARLELKLFLLFSGVLFAASLRNPMVSVTTPQWQVLSTIAGARYWFLPTVAFAWSIVWCWRAASSNAVRQFAACTVVVMCIGITRDWSYPRYANLDFPKYAGQFAAARAGTMVTMPIFPPGWLLRLTKRVPECQALPLGYIDVPAERAKVSGETRVAGWGAASGRRIQRVSLLVDNNAADVAILTLPRPDADATHSDSPDKNKGWETVIDTSKLSPGTHEIEAWAQEAGGCEAEIAAVSIEKVP